MSKSSITTSNTQLFLCFHHSLFTSLISPSTFFSGFDTLEKANTGMINKEKQRSFIRLFREVLLKLCWSSQAKKKKKAPARLFSWTLADTLFSSEKQKLKVFILSPSRSSQQHHMHSVIHLFKRDFFFKKVTACCSSLCARLLHQCKSTTDPM